MGGKATGAIRIGIGGWTYEPWRGIFYPDKLPQKRELEYASRQLTSIEVNGTFYGSQKPETFAKWRDEAPDGFVFSLKAPRFATNRKVLAEAAIDGVEVECAVLEGVDGAPPEASLPGQIVVDAHSTWYDFEAKYLAAETRMEIPAPIPAPAAERVRALSCAAFDAISCEGLARVDCFYTPDGDVLVNEINTMPGMTPHSGFPMMWAASGLPMPALIDRIITTALVKPDGPR